MSMFPLSNPNTAPLRDLPPGPHAGVTDDSGEHSSPASMDSRARNALTLGILSLVLGVVTGVPAIWLGRQALAHIGAAGVPLKGRWAAWTGIGLGCVGIGLTIALWVFLHERGS